MTDTPMHRDSISDLSVEQFEQHLTALRERRMALHEQFKAHKTEITRLAKDKVSGKVTRLFDLATEDFRLVEDRLERIERRLFEMRAYLLMLEE